MPRLWLLPEFVSSTRTFTQALRYYLRQLHGYPLFKMGQILRSSVPKFPSFPPVQ